MKVIGYEKTLELLKQGEVLRSNLGRASIAGRIVRWDAYMKLLGGNIIKHKGSRYATPAEYILA